MWLTLKTGGTRTIQLQQRDSTDGTWRIIQTQTTNSAGFVKFSTPKRTTEGWVQYRMFAPAITGYASQTFSVTQVNVKKVSPTVTWESGTVSDLTKLNNSGMKGDIKVSSSTFIPNIDLIIERQINNGSWTQISKKTTSSTPEYANYLASFSDPRQNITQGSVNYRVRLVSRNADIANVTSTTRTVKYDIQNTAVTANPLGGGSYAIPAIETSRTISVKFSNTYGGTREVWVQKYNASAKTWPIVKKLTVVNTANFNFTRADTAGTYRIHIPAAGQYRSYTSNGTNISKPVNAVSLGSPALKYSGNQAPWVQNQFSTTVNIWDQKATVYLQKRVGTTGDKWIILETRKNVAGSRVTFNLPKGNSVTRNATTEYRIWVSATAYTKSAGTTKKVYTENPNLYTGTAKTAYGYMKAHCPNAVIQVTKLPAGTAGTANGDNNRIQISTSVASGNLRTVALHECAHLRQGKFYSSDWSGFKKRMATLYGNANGWEQNADCIANAWSKNSYWAYGQNCSGERGKAATILAQNKKY